MDVRRKFIFDTDPGIDDTQAIFIGLKHFEVLAFTTVAGNTEIDQININLARCLEIADK